MERVACYIRVSTEEQKLHGISLDAQRAKLLEYANVHDLKIYAWYEDEGVSGRKLIRKRPELQRMLNDAHERKFDRIIFIKLDRFFRSVAEYHECMKYIDPVVWTATEEKYDLTTANGRAFVNMKLTIAELEADQTGERIKIVNDYKVKTGQAISGYKALTLGFKTATIDGVKRVVKNPDTADVVSDFLDHFLTYNNKTQAYRFIKEKYGVKTTFRAFDNMLKDTKLYGSYRGNDNYCEAYLTKDQFDKIQYILAHNSKCTPSGQIYLFSGLIKCPKCGRTLIGKRDQHPYGLYIYYKCAGHYLDRNCDFKKGTKENLVERQLLDSFDRYINNYINATVITDAKTPDVNAANKIAAIKKEIDKVNKIFRYSDTMTDEEYEKEIAKLNIRLKDAQSASEPIKQRDLSIYHEVLNSGWISVYNALNAENKKAFWRKYIKELHIDLEGNVADVIFF